jgi:hypothetical protein
MAGRKVMELVGGSRIGPYEIAATIGAGGMGVVYRARDTRLGRDVALKVLAEDLRGDAVRQRRFEQEARATGALNHPNVVAVYDVGDHDGTPFLVTELLEGMTLRARLREGPVPLRKALDWAGQIARGLAAAHEKGLVHRDLKPENIFLTRDGRVKILDFGLARDASTNRTANEPTLAATEPGAVMGTAGYMAPEQVRGRPADARADIFAFGAVLYELLCGRKAFDGDNSIERAYAILNHDPATLLDGRCNVSPGVERVVRRCLEKDPEERFQSARDLAFAIEALAEPSSSGDQVITAITRRNRVERVAVVGVVLAIIVVAFAVGSWTSRRFGRAHVAPPATQPAAEVPYYTRLTFRPGTLYSARIADEGRSVVYTAAFGDDVLETYLAIPGRRGARAVSPPWHEILAVSRSGEMALRIIPERGGPGRKMILARSSLAGGAPREVAEDVSAADFGPDGELLIVRAKDGKSRIEYPVGKVRAEIPGWVSRARVAPAGDRIALLHHPLEADDRGSVEVVSLGDQPSPPRVVAGPFWTLTGLAWRPDGKELWFGASRASEPAYVIAVTLDGQERVVTRGPGRLSVEDIAPDGRVLLGRTSRRHRLRGAVASHPAEMELSWYDSTWPIYLSNDGSQVLFIEGGEASVAEIQTFLRRTDGSPAVHLAEGRGRCLSPDGTWAVISPKAPFNTLSLVPTGPGAPRPLPPGGLTEIYRAFFTPDGKQLVIQGRGPRTPGAPSRAGLWLQDLRDGPPRLLSAEDVRYMSPPSPDGKYVAAYLLDGRVLVVPLDGRPPRPIPGVAPGDLPVSWTADSRGVYVRRPWVRGRRGVEVVILDVASGKTRPWRTLTPPDLVGVPFPGIAYPPLITPDGKSYVYGFIDGDADLFLVSGLR